MLHQLLFAGKFKDISLAAQGVSFRYYRTTNFLNTGWLLFPNRRV